MAGKKMSTPADGFHHGVHKAHGGLMKPGKGSKSIVVSPSNAGKLGKACK